MKYIERYSEELGIFLCGYTTFKRNNPLPYAGPILTS